MPSTTDFIYDTVVGSRQVSKSKISGSGKHIRQISRYQVSGREERGDKRRGEKRRGEQGTGDSI